MKNKLVLLYSGGLDSLGSLLMLKDNYDVLLLFIDYNQRAVKEERKAFLKAVKKFNLDGYEINIPWYGMDLNSPLIDKIEQPPMDVDLDSKTKTRDSAVMVWLPNRNGLFLNIAAYIAERYKIDTIACGFNAEEARTFPDNTMDFLTKANAFFELSTMNKVKVISPVIDMQKHEIVRIIMEHKAEYLFYSCYLGNDIMCGRCESCKRAIRAFSRNGYFDEIRERFDGI